MFCDRRLWGLSPLFCGTGGHTRPWGFPGGISGKGSSKAAKVVSRRVSWRVSTTGMNTSEYKRAQAHL